MKDFDLAINKCMTDLHEIGCPIASKISWRLNTKSLRRWGCCIYNYNSYTIEISSRLLEDDAPIESLYQTIYHELLHTVPNGLTHSGAWKTWANKVNAIYGTHISRVNSADNLGVVDIIPTVAKYKILCDNCGNAWYFQRETKAIRALLKNKHSCRCSACQGSSFTVDILK